MNHLPTVHQAGEDEQEVAARVHRTAESSKFPFLLQKSCKRFKLTNSKRPRKTRFQAPLGTSGLLRKADRSYTGIQGQLSQHSPPRVVVHEAVQGSTFPAMTVASCPIFKYPESHSEGGSRSERTVIHLSAPARRVSADRSAGVSSQQVESGGKQTYSKGTTTRLRTAFFFPFSA